MTVRLTLEHRQAITTALLHHAFDAKIAALTAEYAAFAVKLYDMAFEKHIKQIDALPEGWLESRYFILVQIGEKTSRYDFSGKFANYNTRYFVNGDWIDETDFSTFVAAKNGVFRRFPYKFTHGVVSVFNAGSLIASESFTLANQKADLIEEWRRVKGETLVALSKFKTLERLLEAWPEIQPFTKSVAPTQTPKFPAIPISDLNKMLDLPVSE